MNIWAVIDHIFSTRCVLCGAASTALPNLCDGCLGDLPRPGAARCPICATPAPPGSPCGNCLQRPPAFLSTRAALRYAGPVASLMQSYKFRGDLAAGAALAHVMLRDRSVFCREPECLVPVPLHPARLRQRGFNQSLELARMLRRATGIPLAVRGVRRRADRPPQTTLAGWSERWRNVRGVFHVEPGLVRGRRVAIVDDVMTSGATAQALARALLRQGGACEVVVWVAARAG